MCASSTRSCSQAHDAFPPIVSGGSRWRILRRGRAPVGSLGQRGFRLLALVDLVLQLPVRGREVFGAGLDAQLQRFVQTPQLVLHRAQPGQGARRRHQLLRFDRLGQIRVGAALQSPDPVRAGRVGRGGLQHEDPGPSLFHDAADVDAAHVGQLDVEQQHGGLQLLGLLQRVGAGRRFDDIEATRRACAKFALAPTSVMNFAEGTRFTPAKHRSQRSPYRHLLKPKAGALALALGVLGDKFDALLDVTIVYPDGAPTFWQFLRGDMRRVVVHVRRTIIPPEFRQGNYAGDPRYRKSFQRWLQALWAEKDARIDGLIAPCGVDAGIAQRRCGPIAD